MSDRLTPTQAHSQLDRYGWLDAAMDKAIYSLCLHIPDDAKAAWDREFDVSKRDFIDQLNAAKRLLYVGASHDAYARIMDHCNGQVRQTAIMRVCPPVEVHGIWPVEGDLSAAETNLAIALAGENTLTWSDGVLR